MGVLECQKGVVHNDTVPGQKARLRRVRQAAKPR